MASSQLIIFAIIATSIATYISRFMGALTSEKVSVKSKIFKWFNCVAYSTLAALLGRMIIFPAGVLAESELTIRLIVFFTCIAIFIISKKNLVIPTIVSAILLSFLTNIWFMVKLQNGTNTSNFYCFVDYGHYWVNELFIITS